MDRPRRRPRAHRCALRRRHRRPPPRPAAGRTDRPTPRRRAAVGRRPAARRRAAARRPAARRDRAAPACRCGSPGRGCSASTSWSRPARCRRTARPCSTGWSPPARRSWSPAAPAPARRRCCRRCCRCVDPGDRLLLVEDAGELAPAHPHVVRLEARPANLEGAGAVTLRDLVRQALRMRPDRVVVGEVRGAEVVDLLAALNTGHEGGCGTLHANSAADVPARLEALAAVGGPRPAGAAQPARLRAARGRAPRPGARRRAPAGRRGLRARSVAPTGWCAPCPRGRWDGSGGARAAAGPGWPDLLALRSTA